MLVQSLICFALIITLALADVSFTSPAPGAPVTAGSTFSVSWKDSGTSPLLTDLAGYAIFLMVGGNTEATSLQVLTLPASISGAHSAGTSIAFQVATSAGPNDPNAYFLKMVSNPRTGTGQVVNYSKRFSISGMTGNWPSPALKTSYQAVAGNIDSVPPTANTIANNAQPGAAGADGQFGVSYQFQTTGNTRYAPMQAKPPTKITAQATNPQYPTSHFDVATTFLPIASIVTTVTQSVTYSVSSRENTASPAPMPLDDMQKFLARWVD